MGDVFKKTKNARKYEKYKKTYARNHRIKYKILWDHRQFLPKKTQELRKKPKKMEKKGNKVEKAVSFGRNKFISGY